MRWENDLPQARAAGKVGARVRGLLLVSLVVNVALGVAVITWLASGPAKKSNLVRPVTAATANSNLPRMIVKTNVLIRPRVFSWQEVESPDYAVYVENLRTLGMPDSTIRDIIVADVDQLFAKRFRADAAQQDVEWWRSTPSYEAKSNALARTQAIDTERVELLTKLLGPDWNKGRASNELAPLALTGPVLGNLSDDLKATVQDIAVRSRTRVADYLAQKQAAGESVTATDLAKMREETRQQLASVLSPQQLEEFLLRYSENASRLRRELNGLNTTPDEFRAAFRATDAIDREIDAKASGDDPASQRARQALEQERLTAIQKALGSERFAAYQTIHDPVYRDALAAAQQAGGGEEAALALYEISRATYDEFNRIRNDPTLSEAEKQQQMREAEIEQQRARAAVLGETPATEATANNPAANAPPEPQLRPHTLQPFETLGQLSLRYGLPISAIRAANPGVDINRLRPGTVINIPPPGTPPQPPLPPGIRR